MKIIQINGWCGRLNAPLYRFLKVQDPDFICIQEAFSPDQTSLAVFNDQYDYINEILSIDKNYDYFFTPSWGFELGVNLQDVGNIIISKLPLSDKKEIFTHGEYVVRTVSGKEKNIRTIQSCTVKTPSGNNLTIINYQGYVDGANSLGDKKTGETLETAKEFISKSTGPIIFCCDLNIDYRSPLFKIIESAGLQSLTKTKRVPSTLSTAHRAPKKDRENVACDHIFISDDINVVSFKVSDEVISDHKALILEFDL